MMMAEVLLWSMVLAAQPDGEGQPNDKQWKTMLQKLLADRFQLTFHHDTKELAAYVIAVGKNAGRHGIVPAPPTGALRAGDHRVLHRCEPASSPISLASLAPLALTSG